MLLRSTSAAPLACSFRDPGGRLAVREDGVFRFLNEEGAGSLTAWLNSGCGRKLLRERKVAATEILGPEEAAPFLDGAPFAGVALVARHERILFPSFPYE